MLALLLFAGGTSVAYGAAAAAPPAEHTDAIVKPSVVFIQTEWKGWVMNGPLATLLDLAYGTSGHPPITATITGSGYIANSDGSIITAGHVVDNQTVQYGGKGVILRAAVAKLAQDGYLQAVNLDPQALLNNAMANSRVEGLEAGAPPDRTVTVFRTQAASSVPVSTGVQANVVDFKPFGSGDVALLKVESKTPMPALQVASGAPEDGTSVVAAGYPGSVTNTVDPKVSEPTLSPGNVTSAQTVAGVPFTGISAPISAGMSGGPVVNTQGMVVGTVSWTPGAEHQSFNFMTNTSAVKDMLSNHGVSNTLSTADQAYRAGLTAYFAGKYHEAAGKFDQVLTFEPDQTQAQHYRQLAITNFPNEKSGSSPLLWIGIGAGVLLLLGGGLATFLVLRRRRARGPVSAPAPEPMAPWPTTAPAARPQPTEAAPTGNGAPTTRVPEAAARVEASPEPAAGNRAAAAAPEEADHGTYCPNCGEPHPSDAHFCASCGERFTVLSGHRDP